MFAMVLFSYVAIGKQWDLPNILGNASMLYSLFDAKPIIGVYWTLEVELLFYLLCLGLFLLGLLHRPGVLFLIGLFLMGLSEWIFSHPDIRYAITTATGMWVWAFLPWNLAIMFWGGLFRMWYDDRNRTVLVGSYSVSVFTLVVALLVCILARPMALIVKWSFEGELWALHEMVPFPLALGLFIVGSLYFKVNNRFLVWLGTISYSIYLLHIVAIEWVQFVLSTYFIQWMDFSLCVYLVICTGLSIVMAALVYYAVEKPAILVGRRLQKPFV